MPYIISMRHIRPHVGFVMALHSISLASKDLLNNNTSIDIKVNMLWSFMDQVEGATPMVVFHYGSILGGSDIIKLTPPDLGGAVPDLETGQRCRQRIFACSES